jgi:hypothetical protein
MPAPLIEIGTTLDEIRCTFCEAILYANTPEFTEAIDHVPACPHVFLLAHDEGILYLSPTARAQIENSDNSIDEDGILMELQSPNNRKDRWEILDRSIDLPQAQVLAIYAPAPVFAGWYIGVCESTQ